MTNPLPDRQLDQLIFGYCHTQAVYVAAKLRIADLLKDGPLPVEELAMKTGTHAPSLYRLLRTLASLGVFAEHPPNRFSLTPLAELLQSNTPSSKWALAVMNGEEHYRSWGELLYSVQTGQPSFERIYGVPIFEFLSENREQAEVFDRAMVDFQGRQADGITTAYDFAEFQSVADIGGGNGSLLCAVMKAYPHLHGTLFDLPGVIERANSYVEAAGLAERVHLVDGDFFDFVPAGADLYLLRHIIHDWDDDRSIRILEKVHRAMNQHGRLLVIESVIPPGNDPFFGKLLDLTMLTIPGGRERTPDEYRRLLGEAGFRVSRIVPTHTEVSIVEGVRE